MSDSTGSLADAIHARRSVRGLEGPPLSRTEVEQLVALALAAPAPHHTRPWRFAHVGPERRSALAEAMGKEWRADMTSDGVSLTQQERVLTRSRRQIEEAPTLLLGCIVGEGLREWPDERRRRSEWTMAAHSFGAALQNMLLEASARGLGAFWISAPLYAGAAVRTALALPGDWIPQAAVAFGHSRTDYQPFERSDPDVGGSLIWA